MFEASLFRGFVYGVCRVVAGFLFLFFHSYDHEFISQ